MHTRKAPPPSSRPEMAAMKLTAYGVVVKRPDPMTFSISYDGTPDHTGVSKRRTILVHRVFEEPADLSPIVQIFAGQLRMTIDYTECAGRNIKNYASATVSEYGPVYIYEDLTGELHRDIQDGPALTRDFNFGYYANYYYQHGKLVYEIGHDDYDGRYEIDHKTGKKVLVDNDDYDPDENY